MNPLDPQHSVQMESIVAAAIRYPSGFFALAPPYRHHHIVDYLASRGMRQGLEWQEGFLTNTGRFVNRKDAYQIAEAARQILPGAVSFKHTDLYSEDLW